MNDLQREAPERWLQWVDQNWHSLGHQRLTIGLKRMVVYADQHGLYYINEEGEKRPFREKVVAFVRSKASKKE